jgi:hypothetical protein
MFRFTPSFVLRSRSFGLLLLMISGAALSPALAAADDPPLKGPQVKDQGVPGEGRRFGTDQQGDRKDRNPALQHGLFMRAVNSLKGDQADAKVRLSDDQAQRIDAIDREYREQARAYLAKNADEVRQLMRDLPENERKRVREGLASRLDNASMPKNDAPKGKGRRQPPAEREMQDATPIDPEKAAAAKARLREIHEAAPQSTEVHAKIFAILNADQKSAVESTLKKWKAQAAPKREAADSKDSPPRADVPAREHLREKLKDMTPEERREAIKKLRDRRSNSEQDRPNKPKK